MKITDSNIYVPASHWYGVVYKFGDSCNFAVVSDRQFCYTVYTGYVSEGKLYFVFSESFSHRLEAWKDVLDYFSGHHLLGTCYSDTSVRDSDNYSEFRKYLNLEDKKNETTCVYGV